MEPETDRGSIVATLGMAVSIIVNVIILAAGIFAGAQVLQQLPEIVVKALQLLLPACLARFSCSSPCPSSSWLPSSSPSACSLPSACARALSRFRLDAYRCFRKHRHRDLFL